jgi:hypothetical protein
MTLVPAHGVRNLRSRRFLTVCTGCKLCKARETYVDVGFRKRVRVYA